MLDIRMEIGQINYRSCVEAMLPPVVKHCASKDQPNELEQALARLGSDAVPVVHAVLDRVDTDTKDKMLISLVLAHEEQLRDALNRTIAKLLGGQDVRIGYVLAQNPPGKRITLLATQIRIDYSALLKNPQVRAGVEQLGGESAVLKTAAKFVLKIGAHMSPESLEKHGVTLLNSKRVKTQLLAELTRGLKEAGLEIQLADMVAESNTAILLPERLVPGGAALPDTFEKRLLEMLSTEARKRNMGTNS